MKNRFKLGCGLALGLLLTQLVGCSDTVDDITNNIDCHSVCQRYSDCFDSGYDIDGCTDKCENNADSDSDRQRKLHACDDCIDDRSCTSATFNCADECVGIVP
jgi:hypothetical protein